LIEKIGYVKERPAKYDEHSREKSMITMEMGIPPKADLLYLISSRQIKWDFEKTFTIHHEKSYYIRCLFA